MYKFELLIVLSVLGPFFIQCQQKAIQTTVTCKKCDCGSLNNWVDPLPKIIRINQTTHQFIDTLGRSSIFHGTNVVTKVKPFHPTLGGPDVCNSSYPSPFCDADMDYFQSLGINVVRLGTYIL